MTGLVDSNVSTLQLELDRVIEALTPAVEALLRRIAPDEQVTTSVDSGETLVEVPLQFPDGIGRGRVIASLFRYHDTVRLDIDVVHNRHFARPNGTPSDRRCFFNDYKASVTLKAGETQLPENFERKVVAGVLAAREGVNRYNRAHPEGWHQIHVVAAD